MRPPVGSGRDGDGYDKGLALSISFSSSQFLIRKIFVKIKKNVVFFNFLEFMSLKQKTKAMAYSKGDGKFEEVMSDTGDPHVRDFALWSRSPGVSHLLGDFDGNGSSDIALVGGKNWRTIPVAFSREK